MIPNKIDADTHVDETEATWEYLTEAERRFKPIPIEPGEPPIPGDSRPHRLWLVDGRMGMRRWRSDERTGTTREKRELHDVKARVAQMDELGIEVQVLYPTFLLVMPTTKPDWQAAICRSYNRWLADRTAESNGRLRWVMPPVDSMDDALEELRFGKEHGAVGVFKRAIEAGGRTVADPYFFPLYEEAQRLDLPICIHAGGGVGDQFARPEIGCFSHLALGGVPLRFPTLRFGVIEAMASWVPYIIADFKAKGQFGGSFKTYAEKPMQVQDDFLRDNRFYVTAQTNDDVPYLMKFGGQDSLMIGTDYGHEDQSAVLGALESIERLEERGDLAPGLAQKILVDNPRAFYAL
jgi:predicted TIM-barrel fold metal-dependent hydrolase